MVRHFVFGNIEARVLKNKLQTLARQVFSSGAGRVTWLTGLWLEVVTGRW